MAKKGKFDLSKVDLKHEATRQFYAGVGVTDLAVEYVREYVADVQKRFGGVQGDVTKGFKEMDFQPEAMRKQAMERVNARFEALSKDAKARRKLVEDRVAEVQKEARALPERVQGFVTDNVSAVNEGYEDLVKRGERLVGRVRRQESTKAAMKEAKVTVTKAKTTRTQAEKAAKETVKSVKPTAKKRTAAPRSSAKATVTAARKTAESTAKAVVEAAEKLGA